MTLPMTRLRKGSGRWLGLCAAFAVTCWAVPAHALPTPDAIIGSVQVLPVLFGVVGAGGAWAARKLWRLLGGEKDARRPLATMAIVLGVAWVVTAVLLVSEWSKNEERTKAANIAAFLRCDPVFHEHRLEKAFALSSGSLLPRIKVKDFAAEYDKKLAEDPSYNPVLLSSLTTKTMYDSGFLGVGPEGKRRYFDFVPVKKIVGHLQKIPAAERASRDVVLELLVVNEHEVKGLEPLLKEFKSARVIERLDAIRGAGGHEAAYGRSGVNGAPTLFVREADGRIRPAERTPDDQRMWPVRVERQTFDELHIRFPGMATTLLTADEARAHALDTPILVTYGPGYSMEPSMALEFAFAMFQLRLAPEDRHIDARSPKSAPRLTELLEKANVFMIDIIDTDEARTKYVADAIGDRPFLIVPLSSLSFVHSFDIPRYIEREARAKNRPFRYLGATLQMPEAVAHVMLERRSSSATGAMRDRVTAVLVGAIDFAANKLGSTGLALLVLGFVVRFVCLPLMVNARRVKILQKTIGQTKREYLTRLDAAKAHLKLGALYELPGALANVLFLVPFFAAPTERLKGHGFAWIADLAKPDLGVSVVLGVLFGVVAFLMVGSANRTKQTATFAGAAVGLALVAMFAVPAGIGLYACGGLLITITAEVLAIRAAQSAEERLALETPRAPEKIEGSCLAIHEAADLEEVGGKASALGRVAAASRATGLFEVPRGVVFRRFEALGLDDEAAFEKNVLSALSAKLPGAEKMTFAVRSSAPGEDGANESQAGRYISVLNVSFDKVPDALRKVLESYGEEAVKRKYEVGVLVQAMAPADLAGVMFTRSPGNGHVTHINYTEGLGDRLVSGEVEATEMFVARRTGTVRPAKADKRLAEKLFLAGQAIEKLFGRPQDIEWAYNRNEDQLYLLQSRPITAVEYAPELFEEQDELIRSVDTLKPADTGAKVQWKRSDAREVVDEPSALAASIIQETYAKGGSLDVASERLGIHIPSVDVVPIFGDLYERAAGGLVSGLRFAFGTWRLKRGIEDAAWPARLRAECEKPTPAVKLDATDPRELSRQIVEHLRSFVRDVYPVAVEATVLAKLAQPEDIPQVHTISADMFADLVRGAESGDLRTFVERWGTRSVSDYDPASPDFGEDPVALADYASGFRGMQASNKGSSHDEKTTTYAELVKLKEITKDRAVRYLRKVRPALLRLAGLLKVEPQAIFTLSIGDLEGLADGSRSASDIVRAVAAGTRRERAFENVSLPDELSLADLEFLGAHSEHEEESAAGASDKAGKFVAAKKAFSGRVLHLSKLTADDDLSGAILVTDMLQPSLVKYFGRVVGIVSERGAYLSHAAIVGREAGVPILVLGRALSTLAHGSRIAVTEDGAVSASAPEPLAMPPVSAKVPVHVSAP